MARYMRLTHLFKYVGVPQDCYKLEQVFLQSNHRLKSFKITSKTKIDTIMHHCKIQVLELENFE